ncbi:MAG TPA: hypothetical protein VE173_00420, partial [Longimicrobiales bacterium]|nr:hypothetical protein [Longimicrobiales bacterium]
VWTGTFYDGWTPNYLFFIAHSHNAIGRFYEVASYGPNERTMTANQSREWYRPNPLQGSVEWGPRANTNIQESAMLFSLHFTGEERERWLENYWLKNKRAVERGQEGPVYGWVVPATQHGAADAADAVNELIDQGLEVQTADRDFEAGDLAVKKGDWIIRGDQPYRTLADMYFAVQGFPTTNPSPYDDTGWTFQYERDVVVEKVEDEVLLSADMSPVAGHVRVAGGITGEGSTVIVAHEGDNNLVTLRFRFADVPMRAAAEAFEVYGRAFPPGSFIITAADRTRLEPALEELGLSGTAVASLPPGVPTHDLDVPRIGYIHSWRRTQDEGWVRAAFDTYGIPYTYFGENQVHDRNLRSEFDVIVYPAGGSVGSLPEGGTPIPYRRSEKYPALGYPDSASDVRGQLGEEGLRELYDFVREGGTLIAEGSTASIFPEYELTPGVRVAETDGLIARGSIFRAVLVDETSPIRYGIARNQMPVYFSQAPVFDAGVAPADPADPEIVAEVLGRNGRGGRGGSGGRGGFGGRGGGVYQNTSPMATDVVLSPWDPHGAWPQEGSVAAAMEGEESQGGGGGGRGGFGGFGRFGGGGAGGLQTLDFMKPRVVLRFPAYAEDMLLSGMLSGGENLSNRAQVVDSPVGDGHMVLFAIRPFWRWQTQGTFILGFNAILNWNDLDAGKEMAAAPDVAAGASRDAGGEPHRP